MREVRLTPQAEAEVAEVRRYSRHTWGITQAKRYLTGLGRRFREIAAGTAAHRDAEIGSGYRRCRYRRHIIIFKEEGDSVRIVRVFHERMDIPGRLGEGK
ncbi:MAG: toxin ParE1/3/4 [Sphingomonadales bacterium]|nr:toxin ParE1/3/4 [Sphingomonadales bacterium]